MALIACNDPRFFDKCSRIEWFAPNSNFGDLADFSVGGYVNSAAAIAVTILQVRPLQPMIVSACGPQPGERCNVEAGTGLLLADNDSSGAPISLRFEGIGVRAVGALVVAPRVPFDTDYAPQLWAENDIDGSATHVPGPQGITGDIWMKLGDVAAPFVGVRATAGERIKAVRFDAVHPVTLAFSPLGIGSLYCVV